MCLGVNDSVLNFKVPRINGIYISKKDPKSLPKKVFETIRNEETEKQSPKSILETCRLKLYNNL